MPEIDMPTYVMKEIIFDEIFPLWKTRLWPGRQSVIEPMSSLVWNSGLFLGYGNSEITKDRSIFDKYEPKFFALWKEDLIVGVNSGFRTEEDVYRSRGLWVHPDHRGKGLGQELLKHGCKLAIKENCKVIWSMPRKSALETYEAVGFSKIGDWLDDTVEFGPNAVAYKYL